MSGLGDDVRILGRGRAPTEGVAEDAMRLMLRGEAAPEAVGALLMLMRFRGEGPEKVAGFVRDAGGDCAKGGSAGGARLAVLASGRSRALPWFLLAARLVAGPGRPVLLHGGARPRVPCGARAPRDPAGEGAERGSGGARARRPVT
jgi:anthranilate phosphoribosyltransferase